MKSASKMAMNSPRAAFRPGLERARLVARAIGAVVILDVHALRGKAPDRQLGDALRLVGRIVQHLDLQTIPRVFDSTHRLDEAIGDVHLVVQRELDRDDRRRIERRPSRSDPYPGTSCRGRPGSTGASRKSRG